MLLASERLNVIHVSTHVSLRTAIDRAKPERVLETIRTGHRHLRRMGIAAPRIAVAGINPHCGENGLFGTEDDEFLAPAVAAARAEGIDVVGPISADTVYHRAYNGAFDLVVAQYHDQGHIPIKLVAFDTAVNVSLGLPIDRSSVDHGTAFDIAGTGRANHVNMLSALSYARSLAASRRETLDRLIRPDAVGARRAAPRAVRPCLQSSGAAAPVEVGVARGHPSGVHDHADVYGVERVVDISAFADEPAGAEVGLDQRRDRLEGTGGVDLIRRNSIHRDVVIGAGADAEVRGRKVTVVEER